jgi:hypothetical protein
MEQQWQEIKRAYRRVLNETFSNQQERDYVHVSHLRFAACLVDLILSGDREINRALFAVFGGGEDALPSYEQSTFNQSNGSNSRSNENVNGSSNNISGFGNIPGFGNFTNLMNNFRDLESLFNRQNNNNSDANNNINSDNNIPNNIPINEFRNMFPIFHYMFENSTPVSANMTEQHERQSTSVNPRSVVPNGSQEHEESSQTEENSANIRNE